LNAGRPAQTGTASAPVPAGPWTISGEIVDVKIGAEGPHPSPSAGSNPGSLSDFAAELQALIRGANAAFSKATVSVDGSAATSAYLVVKSGGAVSDVVEITGNLVLGFPADGQNVQQYALGSTTVAGAQGPSVSGSDGTWVSTDSGVANGLIGSESAKTGMYALLDVDLFNILCIPATMNLGNNDAVSVASAAEKLCQDRRAMYILDVPQPAGGGLDKPPAIMTWLDTYGAVRSRNAALYFPRVEIPDPLNGNRLRAVGPSGTMAGVWASTDVARGVWKAPAGTDATLAGVQKLEYKLTDGENGVLNPLAINALRTFPVYGPVSWGARTLFGSDQKADDYKYIPVRRLALYIEESLFRGTQWVVFEPNGAPLWAQIRLNVGAFMHTLFRQGAFAGTTPNSAYYVQCDDKTNPQADINLGIVNILVGFAPLKPAEFVVIQIQQIAGQIES
jgi:Bacteriophage tail sheath protein